MRFARGLVNGRLTHGRRVRSAGRFLGPRRYSLALTRLAVGGDGMRPEVAAAKTYLSRN
jgi:hypothetical protein